MTSISRRGFLEGGSAIAATSLVGGCAVGRPQPGGNSEVPFPVIDIHAHVFNASDLPIYGFLKYVKLMTEYHLPEPAAEVLARWVADTVQPRALEGGKELAQLERGGGDDTAKSANGALSNLRLGRARGSGGGLQPDRRLGRGGDSGDGLRPDPRLREQSAAPSNPLDALKSGPSGDEEDYYEALARELKRRTGKKSGPAGAQSSLRLSKPGGLSDDDRDQIRDLLDRAPGARKGTFGKIEVQRSITIGDISRRIKRATNTVAVFARWSYLLTRPRGDLIRQMKQAYPGVKAFGVSMVDYDHWLNDQSPTPLQVQVSLLSRYREIFAGQGLVLYPVIAFDPYRQLIAEHRARQGDNSPSPLDLVKDAIDNRGFVGVKLYPPMGFRPIGNSELPPRAFRPKSDDLNWDRFPRDLDRALDDLYRWCSRRGVTIKTHTSASQSPSKDARSRSHPIWWERVLKRHRDLRINLGHFGGMREPSDAKTSKTVQILNRYDRLLTGASEKRMTKILELLDRYEHAYADISDFHEILGATATDRKRRGQFFEFLRQQRKISQKDLWRKVLYGSDWLMLARAPGYRRYLGAWRAQLASHKIDDASQKNFFSANARRYLGSRA